VLILSKFTLVIKLEKEEALPSRMRLNTIGNKLFRTHCARLQFIDKRVKVIVEHLEHPKGHASSKRRGSISFGKRENCKK